MSIDLVYLKAPIPCVQGYYGDRLKTFTTQVRPDQVVNLLGHDPRSSNWKKLPKEIGDIYKFLQRPTTKSRREGVAGYIEERFGPDAIAIGGFPSISIAFRDPVEINTAGMPPGVCNLMLDISPSIVRILIDGLGRVTGILDTIDEGHPELLKFQLPITIYAPADNKPLSWREMGQLFHDFNFRVQPVPQRLALSLDTADQYVKLARKLGDYPFLKDHGGVAEKVSSLGGKSTQLVVQTVWVRSVRGAAEGRKFQEANLAHKENSNLTPDTEQTIADSIATYFQSIADEMGDERWTDKDSLHLSSPGWQALGVIHHDIAVRAKLGSTERAKVTKRIAQIDWSRFNSDWLKLGIGMPEIDKATGFVVKDDSGRERIALTGAGRTNTQAIIDYVRSKSGLDLLLKGEEDVAA